MCLEVEDVFTNAQGRNTSDASDICQNVETIVRMFVVAIPFMLICLSVFVIFACLWDRQGLRGWVVMGMSGTYAIRCFVFATKELAIHLAGWNIIIDAPSFCIFLGLSHHLFYLSSNCWTLLLAFDLWNRVRRVMILQSSTSQIQRFILYFVFAFGIPIMAVALACVLEWSTPDAWNGKAPKYGKTCAVQQSAVFLYLGIPDIVLSVPVSALLGHGWFHLWRATRISGATTVNNNSQAQRTLMRRSLRIFPIMGGLFVIDTTFYHTGLYGYSVYLRVPVEAFCRMGIAVLCAWALVCHSNVKNQLIAKYPQSIGRVFESST